MTPSDPDMTDLAGDVTRYREGAGLPSERLDEILASGHSQTLDEPPSARGRLRELSTTKRVLAATGALVVTGAPADDGPMNGGSEMFSEGRAKIGFLLFIFIKKHEDMEEPPEDCPSDGSPY